MSGPGEGEDGSGMGMLDLRGRNPVMFLSGPGTSDLGHGQPAAEEEQVAVGVCGDEVGATGREKRFPDRARGGHPTGLGGVGDALGKFEIFGLVGGIEIDRFVVGGTGQELSRESVRTSVGGYGSEKE